MSLQITQFSDGTIEIYDLIEEGGTQITCKTDGTIELWMIPQYGGEPNFEGNFNTIQEALDHGKTFK